MLKSKFGAKFFLLLLLLIPFSYAQGCDSSGYMGIFKPSTNITIIETCPTCTFINITIKDPSSNVIISEGEMTLQNNVFNFTLNDSLTTESGIYFVTGHSNLDNPFRACFDVDRATPIETSESIIYFILIFLALFIFSFALYGAVILPFSNPRNQLNRIMKIEWTKYLKIGMMVITYLMFLWIINLAVTITTTLISLTQYAGFFEMIFNILMAFTYPLLLMVFILTTLLIVKDFNFNKLLSRGVNPR